MSFLVFVDYQGDILQKQKFYFLFYLFSRFFIRSIRLLSDLECSLESLNSCKIKQKFFDISLGQSLNIKLSCICCFSDIRHLILWIHIMVSLSK